MNTRAERETERVVESDEPAHEAESIRVRMVSEARQTFGVRAAAQLWLKLRLPFVPAMAEAASQADLFERSWSTAVEVAREAAEVRA